MCVNSVFSSQSCKDKLNYFLMNLYNLCSTMLYIEILNFMELHMMVQFYDMKNFVTI